MSKSHDLSPDLAFSLSPERLRLYLQSLLSDQDPPPDEGYVSMVVDRFDQLLSLSADEKPFIYTNGHSASLHFNILAVQSEMDVRVPERLMLGYTQTMMGFLLFHQNPSSIAMIGLGGGSLPKYCYRYLADTSIVVLENNAEIIALRDHFLIPKDDERLAIRCVDGANYLKVTEEKFDVLIVDGFDQHGQPPQLCSQDFYDSCYQTLRDDGVMVVNLIDNEHINQLYIDRIRRSFNDAVMMIPALDSCNQIVFSCKGAGLDISNQELIRRLKRITHTDAADLAPVLQSILKQRQLQTVIYDD